MKTRFLYLLAGISLALAPPAAAAEPWLPASENTVLHGAGTTAGKALGDTILLMGPTGSGAAYLGDFESGWNGWQARDVSGPSVAHWQVSPYDQAVTGGLAAWCGVVTGRPPVARSIRSVRWAATATRGKNC